MSRAPIRKALNSLEQDNLVEIKPRVGCFVVQLTSEKIRDLYEARILFEAHGLEKSIPHIPQKRVKELREESRNLLENSLSQSEMRRHFDLTDRILHKEFILNNIGNQFLLNFSEKILNLAQLSCHLNERIEEAIIEHLRILEGIAKQDVEEAKMYLTKHLRNVEEEIITNL